jgi:putative membrane protein
VNSEAITRKYYSKLKSLPNLKVISGFSVFESILVGLRSITVGVDFLLAFITYFVVSLGLIRELKLSLFFTDLTAFVYLIISFLSIQTFYAFGIFAPLLGYSIIAKYSEIKATLIVFLTSLFPSLFFGMTIEIFIYTMSITLIFYFYIYIINRKGEKIVGLKSLQIARPFIQGILRKDTQAVEKLLDSLGTKTNIRIGMFKIGNYFFIIPKMHFGISGEIGSSKFIYQLNNLSPRSIVFHGPGSHELDLTSSKKSLEIAKRVYEEETNGKWNKEDFYGIYSWESCKFRGVTLLFSNSSLTFLERPELGIDDLPTKLWDFVVKQSDYIVDCHNEYLKEEIPSSITNHLIEEINKIKEIRKTGITRTLKFNVKEKTIEGCEGLCNNRVITIAISDGERKVGIVYLYANNADPSLTNAIRSRLSKIVDIPLLVTPDDHSCTATGLKNLYLPAQPCDNLIREIEELMKETVSNMQEVEVYSRSIDISGVRVIGKVISNMVTALEEVGDYALKTFWIPLVSPILIILILTLLTHSVIKL